MGRKIKLQVCLNEALYVELLAEAQQKGISCPAVVVELLAERYGKTEKDFESDITKKVLDEFKEFSEKIEFNKEYSIFDASPTFSQNRDYRSLLGKKIAIYVADEFFPGVTASRSRTGNIRRRSNGAALYIKKSNDKKD